MGSITVGTLGSIRCAATAAEDRQLAMLVRHDGESLSDFVTRLDAFWVQMRKSLGEPADGLVAPHLAAKLRKG